MENACYRAPRELNPVNLFGVTINRVSLTDVFEVVNRQIETRSHGYILTPNVDHICTLQEHAEFREAYRNGLLAVCDGTVLKWASGLLGAPIRDKLSGSDLIYWLTEYAAQKGYSVFFLGGADGVARKTAEVLQKRYPGLRLAGTYSPPMGFESDASELQRSIEAVQSASPDICFVALGSPKQEIWCYRHHQVLGVPVLVGVGAAFDFVTGRHRRAPRWVQRAGLEWVWRLAQEPRRLGKRYLLRDSRFLPLLIREFFRGKNRR